MTKTTAKTPFLKEYRYPLLTFFLSGLIFTGLLAKTGIFPFGGLTLLMSDMNSIYSDFLGEYQRVLQGHGSLFYSFHAGLGLNFLAIVFFYLPSPLNLLLALFPAKNLLDGITLITVLKVALSGLTMTIYLKKHRELEEGASEDSPLLIAFGVLYALLGYSIVYLFNMIWLDGVILLPLIFLAVDWLIRKGRWLPAVLLYALLFLSNFYIGYMVGFFSAFYFLIQLFSDETLSGKKRLQKMLLFGFSVVLAAGLNAIFLLPTASVLKNGMDLFGQTAPVFKLNFPVFDLFLKLFPGIYDGYKDSLPYIYDGLLTALCLPLYFLCPTIRRREKIGSALLLLFMIASFNLAPLDFFWHAFDHPSWFPYRYAFLFPFFTISLAYAGLTGFAAHSEKSTEKAQAKPAPALFTTAAALILYLLLVQRMAPAVLSDSVFLLNLLFILLAAALAAAFLTEHKESGWLIVLLCVLEAGFNADTVLQQYRSQYVPRVDYVHYRESVLPALEPILPKDGEFYRVEKDTIRTYNDPLALGYPGIANFSSVASVSQSRFLKKMGFDCYATWCTYNGRTLFSDSFLGIRYFLSSQPVAGYVPLSASVYENPSAFPVAFFVQRAFADFPSLEADDPIRLQEDLLQAFQSTDHPYYEAEKLVPTAAENLKKTTAEDGSVFYQKTDPAAAASLRYRFTLADDKPHTLFLPYVSLNYDVWVNDQKVFGKRDNYTPFLIDLSMYARGDEVTVRIDLGDQAGCPDDATLYAFDAEQFTELLTYARSAFPDVHFDGKTTFDFTFPAAETARSLLTTVPYDGGWTATADGKPLPIDTVMGSLIGVEVPAGVNNVELRFVPQGFVLGSILSAVSVLILVATVWLEKKKETHQNSSDKM